MVVRMQEVLIPYDGRALDAAAKLKVHSYAGDITYDVDEFVVEISPYTLNISFPYVEGADGLEYCGIYHRIILYAHTVEEVVPFNNPIVSPNVEFRHD